MCGICGVAGRGIIDKDVSAFRDLLWLTALRGPHSTGVFAFNPNGTKSTKYKLKKSLGPSSNFILIDGMEKIQDRMIMSVMTQVYMGHCRYATVGKINSQNAHPFDTGRYVGTHNGTLKDTKYRHPTKTDSEMMFDDMEKRGIPEVLSDLDWDAAYSIAMFDKHTKSLTLTSNGERPLYLAVLKKRDVLFYASELRMLHFVLQGTAMEANYFSLVDNDIYTAKVTDITSGGNFWSVKTVEPKKKPVSTIITGMSNSSSSHTWNDDIPFGNDELDDYCIGCGSILYGKSLHEAQSYAYDGKTYHTCKSCLGDTPDDCKTGLDEDKEVRVG